MWKHSAVGWPMPPTISATPNHAVTAAYAPRISGPPARATIMPPRSAAAFEATLEPAVLAHLALDLAPQRRGELSQVTSRSIGCDLWVIATAWQ